MDISDWFSQTGNKKNKNFLIQSKIIKKLRYGENPRQKAAIYKNTSILNNKNSFFNMSIIQGKELSYNNINDMQAGCLLAEDINEMEKMLNEYLQFTSSSFIEKDELFNLIKSRRPDIRIIGTDYIDRDFTGKELTKEIYYHKRDHDYSSSNLKKNIHQSFL